MLIESLAIASLVLVLLLILVRAGHPGYAAATLPAAILPVAHLIMLAILRLSGETLFGVRASIAAAFVDMLAVVGTCVAVALISLKMDSKLNRKLYIIALAGYSVVLGWVYIWNSLQVLL